MIQSSLSSFPVVRAAAHSRQSMQLLACSMIVKQVGPLLSDVIRLRHVVENALRVHCDRSSTSKLSGRAYAYEDQDGHGVAGSLGRHGYDAIRRGIEANHSIRDVHEVLRHPIAVFRSSWNRIRIN